MVKGADTADRIILNTTTGDLYYDADGNLPGLRVQFAAITGLNGTLDATDFFL